MALFNLQSPFNQSKKRGRIHHEDISGIQNPNSYEQSSTGKNITAEANDWTTRKVNDPKNVLNRPIRNREHKKGYRYTEEKDGSLTLKGRKGNPLNQTEKKSTTPPPKPKSSDYMDKNRLIESGKKYAAAVAKWEAKHGKKS